MEEARARIDSNAIPMPERFAASRYYLVALGLIVYSFLLFAALHSRPIDDAYISFRYVDNWLHGKGLVFNPGERVEGYSNFLWVLLLSLIRVSPPLVSVLLDVVFAVVSVALLFVAANLATSQRRSWWALAAPLLLSVNGLFIFWIGKGMEVVFYTGLQIALAVFVLSSRQSEKARLRDGLWAGLIAAAIALTRPEGAVAPAVVLAALAVADRGRRTIPFLALVILAAAVGGQFIFRLTYYGPLWPNTYYAKRLPLSIALDGGFNYLRKFIVGMSEQEAWFYPTGWASHLPIWLVCATAWVFAARQWRRLWPVALQMLTLAAVAVYVGGDWMPAFRFFVPTLPLGCLLAAVGLSEMAGDATAPRWRRFLAPGLMVILFAVEALGLATVARSHEFLRWHDHLRNYGAMASWLKENAPAGSLVALSDIGIISYYNPELRFIDVLGLTDPHIASLEGVHYLKTDVDYVLRRRPDYVLAMLYAWPDEKKLSAKTRFDAAFLSHAAEKKDYEKVTRVSAWREGLQAERYVLFEVYKRASPDLKPN